LSRAGNLMIKNLDLKRMAKLFTVGLFVLLSVAGFGFSVYLFLVARSISLYLIAVAFLFLSIVSGFFNILASYWYYRSFEYDDYIKEFRKKLRPMKKYPSVSVVMPTHNEDIGMIRKNIIEIKKLAYRGRINLFLLNDSSNRRRKAALERICKEQGIDFIYRDTNDGYKAGALNNFLNYSKDDFIAIFDADEYLADKNFLEDIMPYFQDRKIAYVQTEKRYRKGTFFSDSVDIFDAFFFKFIETARAMDNTAIFSGSCGVIRRSVIDEVGGFPEYAIEDTFFSLESDLKGYRGFYLPKIYAYGKPIDTFSKLVKQQWRYNYGDTQFISYFFKKKGFKKKELFPTLNYMAHGFGLNYLSIVLILFTIISVAIVFSALPFAHIGIRMIHLADITPLVIAELLGLFAFLLSMFAPAILTKIYFKSFKKGVMVFLLNYALAFVRAKAALMAMLGIDRKLDWNTDNSERSRSILSVLDKTKAEITFVAILVALGVIALLRSNISGGVWLIWYGGMYALTPLFLHIYG
jgi:cellulose synthase/poly-beta-1,6-N-acetylglucosamine synthase-like glycosyltransferase